MINTRNISEGPDVIPSENNHLTTDGRFSVEKQTGHLIGQRQGYDRPLGTANLTNTSVGYAQTPIGHGTHPVNPTSPVKLREVREIESHLPTTSTFATNSIPVTTSTYHTNTVPIQSGFRTAGQPIIAGGSHVGVHEEVVGTHIRPVGPATITTAQSEIRTVPRTIDTYNNALEGSAISEIRGTDPHFESSFNRQGVENSPTQQSRWEAHHADQSSIRYENHQVFENWENNRDKFVSDRLNVMDDLLAGMDRKLDWLETGVHMVIQFFTERVNQEKKYYNAGKHYMPTLGEHFEKVDDPVLFSNFSRGMKENDAFHLQDRRNSEIMANFIQKDIIDWILKPCENDYKLQTKTLKNPLRDFRRKLNHSASSRNGAYKKYFNNYDALQRSSKIQPSDQNIFKRQLKYSLNAREELRLLKLYDEQGLMVINEFTRLATLRMNEIQRAFSLYLQKYLELYTNSAPTPEPILDLIESANGAEAVQSLFIPRNLMTYNNYEFLKRQFNKEEISYNDLTCFLVNFPDSVDPARSAFITREWEAVKVGGFLGRARPCTILATNSNNLLVIERKYEDQETGRVKNPFNLRFTSVQKVYASQDGTGTIVSIRESTPSGVFHSHTKAKLKFETPEEAQNFLDFLGSRANTTFDATNHNAGQFVTSQVMTNPVGVSGLNTSNLYGSQIAADPLARSLGNQVQAGHIVSSHVISSRPILTNTVQEYAQPISSTVLRSEPITQTIVREQPVLQSVIREQPIVQTITREPVTRIIDNTSTAKYVSQQMTGDV